MKEIFLTGGTGFIGSHVVKQAINQGQILNCLRRSGSNPKINFDKQPNWINGEYEDNFKDIFKKCDLLIHLASHSTNYPYDTLENCLLNNVTRPLAFLQKAKKSGIKKFIIIGSGFEYGLSGNQFKYIPAKNTLKISLISSP